VNAIGGTPSALGKLERGREWFWLARSVRQSQKVTSHSMVPVNECVALPRGQCPKRHGQPAARPRVGAQASVVVLPQLADFRVRVAIADPSCASGTGSFGASAIDGGPTGARPDSRRRIPRGCSGRIKVDFLQQSHPVGSESGMPDARGLGCEYQRQRTTTKTPRAPVCSAES